MSTCSKCEYEKAHLSVGSPVVVRVELETAAVLVVQNLHGALLADAVAHLAGVHPHGQVLRQVLEHVLYRDAALAGRLLEHGVNGRSGLDAPVRRAAVRLLRVPVSRKLLRQAFLQLFAEYVHPPSGQLVVQIRDHEIQRDAHLDVHSGPAIIC